MLTMIVAVSNSQLVLIAIVILAATALLTRFVTARRHAVWRKLAARRGLRFSSTADGPRVSGLLDHRLTELSVSKSSSDRDVGGVAVFELSVALHGVPEDMTVEEMTPGIGPLAARSEEHIEFDDSEFARKVLVQGPDAPRIRRFWSQERQNAFLELMESLECDQLAIENGAIVARRREIVSDPGVLERILDSLLATAAELDGEQRC